MVERQRRMLCVVGHTNEYLTSQVNIIIIIIIVSLCFISFFCMQVCSVCGARMENARIDDNNIYALKHCQRCNKIMNRDKNAASNMFSIMQSSINGDGRPPALSRS
jgi:hypothetical protein